jgi:hypothetical protein
MAPVLHQNQEGVEESRRKRNRRAILEEETFSAIQAKPAELE